MDYRTSRYGWRIQNEAIWVGASRDDQFVIRTYDIASLLFRAPDFAGIQLGGGTSPDAGGSIFDFNFDDNREEQDQLFAEDFLDMVQEAIAPQAWLDGQHLMRVRGNTVDCHSFARDA